MELLCKEEGRHHVLVLFGMPTRYMVEKIPFMFRQVSYFCLYGATYNIFAVKTGGTLTRLDTSTQGLKKNMFFSTKKNKKKTGF